MTNEDKQLLLKDLCARLPYGVICTDLRHADSKITEVNIEDGLVYCPDFDEYVEVENCHLYLRPMSSMTDDERDEFRNVGGVMSHNLENDTWALCAFAPEAYDWLNAHHFDYRGLIEKGLALEAPEGMYKEE